MNKTVEAIKNGMKPSAEELFGLVNEYDITMLSIQDKSHKTVLEMDVNYFEPYNSVFEFGQLNTDTKCTIGQPEILSVEPAWIEEEDMVHIKCCLPDSKVLNLVIFHAANGQKLTSSKEYEEISLFDLDRFLQEASGDKPTYCCSMVKIKNNFGFNMRMAYPKQAFINMEDEGTNGELNIADDVNSLKLTVMDNCCNRFYQKDNKVSVEILIKPYNESFMEVRMFFEKRS